VCLRPRAYVYPAHTRPIRSIIVVIRRSILEWKILGKLADEVRLAVWAGSLLYFILIFYVVNALLALLSVCFVLL
jgi:hypothetical protein